MPQDSDFQGAILEAPHDVRLRHVYADWLEEQGDPRSELIRLQEAARSQPVFDDAAWAPRLRQLLRQTDAEWLQVLGYRGWRPVLSHGWPTGWRERWRVIRAFVETWHGKPLRDAGVAGEPTVERLLKRTRFKGSVREWARFTYEASALQLEVLRDGLPEFGKVPGHDRLSLLRQAEGDTHWSIDTTDLRLDDPPVQSYSTDLGAEAAAPFTSDGPGGHSESTSVFALEYVLNYTFGQAGGFWMQVADPNRLAEELTQQSLHQTAFSRFTLFEAPQTLAMLSGSRLQVWKHARKARLPRCLRELARGA